MMISLGAWMSPLSAPMCLITDPDVPALVGQTPNAFRDGFYRRLIIPQDLIMQSASYAKYQTVSKRELISGFPPSISCTKYKNTGCPGKAQGSRYFFNAQCQTVPGRPPYKNSAENFWTNLRSGFLHLPTGCNERLIIKTHDLMRGRRPSLFHHRS